MNLKKLFGRKKADKSDAERIFFEMFYDHVYRTAFMITRDPHIAQDVLQESFLKAFSNFDKVDDGDKVKAWLTTITSRTAIDFIRKKNRWNETSVEDVIINRAEMNQLNSSVEEQVELDWTQTIVRQKIDQLNPDDREIIILKYILELKDQEIAELLHLNVGTAKSRVHRAKLKLKPMLREVVNNGDPV
jgi:RNA polymerase sigma-70 factor (ECF subfamily)